MITDDGKIYIKGFLGGQTPTLGRSIALGVGSASPAGTDSGMQFEIERANLVYTTYDYVNDLIVYKADLSNDIIGQIYEIGLYASDASFESTLVTTFDSETEEWLTAGADATFTSANTRIGIDSLSHTPAANQTTESDFYDLSFDFSDHDGGDQFKFAYNVANANTSQIVFSFYTDDSNYYQFSLGAQTSGYKIVGIPKASAVATGAPNWDSITQISVATTSKSTGASNVNFDGIRIDDTVSPDPSDVLIAREVLVSPFVRDVNKDQQIEFSIGVNL